MRHYYARIDTIQEGKKEYGHGFCNSKTAVAFLSVEAREKYLRETYDLSAKKIKRAEAIRYACPIFGDRMQYGVGIELRPRTGDTYEVEYLKMHD